MNNDIDSKILSGKTIKNMKMTMTRKRASRGVVKGLHLLICSPLHHPTAAKHSSCHRNRDGEVNAGVDDFDHSGDDFDDGNNDGYNIKGVLKKVAKIKYSHGHDLEALDPA